MSGRLQDKHILLTGAGGGIGLAVALAFLAEGARCTVTDIAGTPPNELGAAVASGRPRRPLVVGAVRDREQHDRTSDADGGCGGGPGEPCEVSPLVVGQRAERICAAARHGGSQVQ